MGRPQTCDEMQLPTEQQRGRERIESEFGIKNLHLQPKSAECRLPLRASPVIVWQCHAVRGVAEPVHSAQGRPGERPFQQMVLHHDGFARHPAGFGEQAGRVCGVVQHINEHHHIHTRILVWNADSVEVPDCDRCTRALQHVDALDGQIGPLPHDHGVDLPVPAADIEHAGSLRNQGGQPGGQHARAAVSGQRAMQLCVEVGHS